MLAGALAYRLFVVLLPAALLLVSGLGLYAGAVDRTPTEVTKEAGLTGLIASQVAAAASSSTRWLIFLVMVPTVLYAIVKLYRVDRDRVRHRLGRIGARRAHLPQRDRIVHRARWRCTLSR